MAVIMFSMLLHVASMVSLTHECNESTKNTTEMPHTVSGFSSGADMAMIHMVAFSSHVLGMGIVGGAPYGCNIMPNAGDTCGAMAGNNRVPWTKWLHKFSDYIADREQRELIDPLKNLFSKKVFLFSGKKDTCVYRPVMRATQFQMQNLTRSAECCNDSNVKVVFNIAAEHAWIVDNYTCSNVAQRYEQPFYCGPKGGATPEKDTAIAHAADPDPPPGGCCGVCDSGGACFGRKPPSPVGGPFWHPPINNCGYDLSGEMFTFLTGETLKPRTRGSAAHLQEVDQDKYVPNGQSADSIAMGPTAYLYVPDMCRRQFNTCRLHVHYHCCDCSVNAWRMGTSLILSQGMLEWAEPNGIMVLYPQTNQRGIMGGGCWDWAGSLGENFDTKEGLQLLTVMSMIQDIKNIISDLDF